MKYQCDKCDKIVEDTGPYETDESNYICLDCKTE